MGPYPERFEFKRLGDKPCDVTVSVDIDWQVRRLGRVLSKCSGAEYRL